MRAQDQWPPAHPRGHDGALRGRRRECGVLDRLMAAHGEGQWLTAAHWATAVLYNGLARYDQALAAAGRGAAYPDELGLATWSMAELIAAAARTGAPGRAGTALRRLSETTRASGTDWALGTEARARALLSQGEAAERLYREAIERLGRTRVRGRAGPRAPALRRMATPPEPPGGRAGATAGRARDAFRDGDPGFADRARRELLATGETGRKRTAETAAELTPQEMQIARLAGDGRTNPEIGVQLFISARTVEWHLRKIFAKLAITSRRELRAVLPAW
jgi:DNA-binding CsgD family transcriptional regulator